jgi:uncharacterized UBP type Zn finger protein
MPEATGLRRDRDGVRPCDHVSPVHPIKPHSTECQECIDGGTRWVALSLCLSCGWVACSDDSPGRHAMAHYQETDHPVVLSLERTPRRRWCYVHRRVV